jgi:hypothetical protein
MGSFSAAECTRAAFSALAVSRSSARAWSREVGKRAGVDRIRRLKAASPPLRSSMHASRASVSSTDDSSLRQQRGGFEQTEIGDRHPGNPEGQARADGEPLGASVARAVARGHRRARRVSGGGSSRRSLRSVPFVSLSLSVTRLPAATLLRVARLKRSVSAALLTRTVAVALNVDSSFDTAPTLIECVRSTRWRLRRRS